MWPNPQETDSNRSTGLRSTPRNRLVLFRIRYEHCLWGFIREWRKNVWVYSIRAFQILSPEELLSYSLEYVPLKTSDQLYFLRLPKVWRMLHHGSVGWVQKKKKWYFMFSYTFFVVFHYNICVSSFSFLFLIKYKISTT